MEQTLDPVLVPGIVHSRDPRDHFTPQKLRRMDQPVLVSDVRVGQHTGRQLTVSHRVADRDIGQGGGLQRLRDQPRVIRLQVGVEIHSQLVPHIVQPGPVLSQQVHRVADECLCLSVGLVAVLPVCSRIRHNPPRFRLGIRYPRLQELRGAGLVAERPGGDPARLLKGRAPMPDPIAIRGRLRLNRSKPDAPGHIQIAPNRLSGDSVQLGHRMLVTRQPWQRLTRVVLESGIVS